MAKAFPRTRRVAEQIRRELAELLREEISDPRLAMVSMTSVEVSKDLAYAKVYITILGNTEERPELLMRLNQVAPLLRHELGRRMHIRTVPRLQFIYDEIVEQGAQLSSLISAAVAADLARHQDTKEEDEE
jgi:ribosome-binding factor A